MSNEKKERKMTLRGFVHKASSAKSAIGFLASHAEFIRQYSNLAPLLDSYEKGKELAGNTLKQIRDLAYQRMLDEEIEAARLRGEKSGEERERKVYPYTVTIFCKDGSNVVEGKSDGFSLMQEAERWADRRLFEDASSLYAEVVSTHIGKNGPIKWTIQRGDAIARTLPRKVGPVMKGSAKSTGKLSFGVKAKNDTFYFSRG